MTAIGYLEDIPDGDADSISDEIDPSFHPVAGRRDKDRAEELGTLEERHEHRSSEADGGADYLGAASQASDIHLL